jgi:murein L,D-transpeptidase YcbB/YkuD
MRGSCLIPVLMCAVLALTFAARRPACAQEQAAAQEPQPVLAVILGKLGDPDLRKGADADDLAALQAFYKDRTDAPLWTTDMGFSAKGQAALFEIEKAGDWGLDAGAFDLPAAGDLPAGPDAEALAEIKLDLAILKYARYARGGRSDPTALGGKVFQTPPLRDPNTVLAEIANTDAPDAYLRALQPRHEQFARLREALRAARDGDAGTLTTDAKRIILNMERWRWMPEALGRLYVWSNTPAFMLYVVKDGATIYEDKTQVGTIGYATPVLSADMTTVVFNPEWIAPPTVLRQNLAPALRKKNYTILKKSGFSVSRDGAPVDPTKVDWAKVNIMDYTFTQRPGPHSNVGKVKFLLPNKYAFVLHDTWPERYKYYQQSMRAVGHDCVRMAKPDDFAKVILAEGNGLPADKVEDLWNNAVNDRVALDTAIPVYSTYFTAVADETGKVTTYEDLYGLDHQLAQKLFGTADGFPQPAPQVTRRATSKAVRWKPPNDAVTRSMGFVGD